MPIKRIFSFALAASCIIFIGCSKGEIIGDNLPEGKLISLQIKSGCYSDNDLSYFFVNSMNGKLLNSQKLDKQTSTLFEVSKIENGASVRYNFTQFFANTNGYNKEITINTYIGMLPLSKRFSKSIDPGSYYSGTAGAKFTDVPAYNSFLLACPYFNITSGDLYTGSFWFPVYDNKPTNLFIRLNTSSGGLYKYYSGLQTYSAKAISLAGMSNSFGSQNIICNSGNFTSSTITINKYVDNDFTASSYSVFSLTTSGSPPTSVPATYPSEFLPSNYTRVDYTGTLTESSSTLKNSVNTFYSAEIPNNLNILDGDFSLTGKYPNRISYTMNLNDKVDALLISWAHPPSFKTANGFSVVWNVYVSPNVREFQLPEIPANILTEIYREYGFRDLKLTEMLPTTAYIYDYHKAQNFDEWMKNYWFGWGDLILGQVDRYLLFNTSGNKKSALTENPIVEPGLYKINRGY